MIAQVVPMGISMSNATDMNFWISLGWKGALSTIALAALLFAIYKGKIKFVVVARRNEKGVRELFGMPAWPVYRGAHLHVDGLSAVRKTVTVPVPIDLRQNVLGHEKRKMDYVGTAMVQVNRQFKHLKQAIYSTLDTDKKDVENEMRDKQSRSILLVGTKALLSGMEDDRGLTRRSLIEVLHPDEERSIGSLLLDRLGSELVELNNEEYTYSDFQVMANSVEGKAIPAAALGATMQPHLASVDGVGLPA